MRPRLLLGPSILLTEGGRASHWTPTDYDGINNEFRDYYVENMTVSADAACHQ